MEEIELSSKYRFVRIYVYIMFLIYPLFFHNFYFDIATCKYIFFMVLTGILIVISMYYLPVNSLDDIKQIKFNNIDYLVFGIMIINVVSVIFSDTPTYGIAGADGRFVGLSTVMCLGVVYFIISRTFKVTDTFYRVNAIGSFFVSTLGILNAMSIDLLGFYNGLEHFQTLFYISTLGHVDVYTSYFAITIPILFICYLNSNKTAEKTLYLVSLVQNIAAVVGGQCDSGYIVLFASFLLAVIFEKKGVKLSIYLIPIVLSSILIKVIMYVNGQVDEPRTISTITKIVYSDKILVALIIIFGISIFINKIDIHKYRKVFVGILIGLPIIYLTVLITFSTAARNVELGKFSSLLRFSDEYGSYRGYIWRVLVNDFKSMPLGRKLVGIGTDSLRPYLEAKYGQKMYAVTDAYYDNAHNELLQYLITTGIIGLLIYIGYIATSIKKAFANKQFILLAVVICYIMQSVVNINQVITTPLFFILLSCINQKNEVTPKS